MPAIRASPVKNWCFTINNPTEEDKTRLHGLRDNNDIKFVVFQLESGDNGTPHYQGYLQLDKKKRLAQVKLYIGDRAHLEVARGSPDDNITYCTKQPRLDGPWTYGESTNPGKRNDIAEFQKAMKARVMTESEIIENYPEILAKYPRFVKTLKDHYAEASITTPTFTPRPGWQSQLHTNLLAHADPRKITWYVDPVGGAGKSTFAREWNGKESFIITGGRHQDIYYAYNRQPVVFFDLARVAREKVPYEVMENFKNGGFLSTKYESRWIKFDVPHVVVFANFRPEEHNLSADRWNIIEI